MLDSDTPPQCFNCGQELPQKVTFCPHCGAPLPTQGSIFKMVGRLLLAIIFAFGALVCGSWGVCAVTMSVVGFGGNSGDVFFGGFILLIITYFCIIGLVKVLNNK